MGECLSKSETEHIKNSNGCSIIYGYGLASDPNTADEYMSLNQFETLETGLSLPEETNDDILPVSTNRQCVFEAENANWYFEELPEREDGEIAEIELDAEDPDYISKDDLGYQSKDTGVNYGTVFDDGSTVNSNKRQQGYDTIQSSPYELETIQTNSLDFPSSGTRRTSKSEPLFLDFKSSAKIWRRSVLPTFSGASKESQPTQTPSKDSGLEVNQINIPNTYASHMYTSGGAPPSPSSLPEMEDHEVKIDFDDDMSSKGCQTDADEIPPTIINYTCIGCYHIHKHMIGDHNYNIDNSHDINIGDRISITRNQCEDTASYM